MSQTAGIQNAPETAQQARRIEELIAKLEACGDPAIVATARALVEALMDLHGAALERMLEIIAGAGAIGTETTDAFSRDDLVGSLLVLYGLHPLDLETRVRRALEKLEPRLRVEVVLVSADEGQVSLRVQTTGSGCGSSAGAIQAAVEEAVYAAAPDVTRLLIEGLEQTHQASGFVPIEMLTGAGMKGAL